jgi:hypothetical protein
MQKVITGKLPMLPNIGFAMVDVRDVATAHLKGTIAEKAEIFSFEEFRTSSKRGPIRYRARGRGGGKGRGIEPNGF